jgi:hypothetical protein
MNKPAANDPERPDNVNAPVLEAVGLEKTFRRPGAPELTILSGLSLAVPRPVHWSFAEHRGPERQLF